MATAAKRDPMHEVFLLALCWACVLTNSTLLTSIGPEAALHIGAPSWLATSTIGAFLAGTALVSLPSHALFSRLGRARAFGLGNGAAVAAALLGVAAMCAHSLACLLAACFTLGLNQGLGQFYRFAAVDVCGSGSKAVAISLVLSGGVLAAFAGPQAAENTASLFGPKYAGSFVAMVAIALCNAAALAEIRFPPPPPSDDDARAAKAPAPAPRAEAPAPAPTPAADDDDDAPASCASGAEPCALLPSTCDVLSRPEFVLSAAIATASNSAMTALSSSPPPVAPRRASRRARRPASPPFVAPPARRRPWSLLRARLLVLDRPRDDAVPRVSSPPDPIEAP